MDTWKRLKIVPSTEDRKEGVFLIMFVKNDVYLATKSGALILKTDRATATELLTEAANKSLVIQNEKEYRHKLGPEIPPVIDWAIWIGDQRDYA